MKIALYSRQKETSDCRFLSSAIRLLQNKGCEVCLYHLMTDLFDDSYPSFKNKEELVGRKADFLFSIGGDGTFIDAANLVGDSGIPILGVNTGRIGFLTNVNASNFEDALTALQNSDYEIDNRTLLHLELQKKSETVSYFALNDISIHPLGESLNGVQVWANNCKVNTYWGDGLIVATPTGSTAYSLSCGGPIVVPTADVILLTPIASHSLTVRPLVLPSDYPLEIKVESRTHGFVLSVDSHRMNLPDDCILHITKEKFTIKAVRLPEANFYSVIREKLLWGFDRRNG